MSRVGSFKITDEQDNKMPPSPIIQEKKPEKTITPAPSMKKTPTFSEKLKRIDDMPAPKKTPTFGDKHFMNTADAKPETPKPKVFPPPPPPPVDQTVPIRPQPPPVLHSPPIRQTKPPAKPGTTETKADAWEREEHRKIKDR